MSFLLEQARLNERGKGSYRNAAWNTVLFEKFCRFRRLDVKGTAQHSDAELDRCRHNAGERVLDVCVENFARLAEADAAGNGIRNARFVVGDVQVDDLQGPYDHAFASFGTMFFASPGAAMRNVRDALEPGGTFMQVVWCRREEIHGCTTPSSA